MAYSPDSIIAVCVVLPVLAIVAVCLRFLVRIKISPTYIGIDDWLAAAAVLFAVADAANLIVGATLGTQGRVYEEIPPARFIVEAKSDYAQLIIEKPLYGMMKLSPLFFFRRIFIIHQRFRILSDILIVLISAWSIAFLFACIFTCGFHFGYHWTPGVLSAPPLCVNINVLNLVYSVTDVIGDILVVAMPFPMIRNLHMQTREKIGTTAAFMLGALSTTASVIRLGFISKAFTEDYSGGGNTHGSSIPPSVWSTVEAQIGVLAACLPPLGPLIRRIHVPSRISIPLHSVLRQGRQRLSYDRMDEPSGGSLDDVKKQGRTETKKEVVCEEG